MALRQWQGVPESTGFRRCRTMRSTAGCQMTPEISSGSRVVPMGAGALCILELVGSVEAKQNLHIDRCSVSLY